MGPADLPAWNRQVQSMRDAVKRELLTFMLLSGLRKNDALTARHEHLKPNALFIPSPKGHRPGDPKRNRAFHLPMTGPMIDCVNRAAAAWAALGHAPSPWLFPATHGKLGRYTDPRAWDVVGRLILSGHALRHSFVNLARAAGVAESDIAVLVNHRTRTVTGSYHSPSSTPEFYLEQMERVSRKIVEAIGS
jgi:integrase